MSACACGERRNAACNVPGWTPISSMKRPRPVSSAESSTRAIDWPTQSEPDPGRAVVEVVASAIRKAFLPRENNVRQEKPFSGIRYPQYPEVPKLTIPSHFARNVQCNINLQDVKRCGTRAARRHYGCGKSG